ncbi:MAG: MATE family efflux transporter [Methanotrichaceae archaeon]|nr:MATE family efflux transporter [Methanotrichaceae archaeon]
MRFRRAKLASAISSKGDAPGRGEDRKEGRINEITEGSILRGLLAVSLPVMAGNMLQSVLEIVDLYFVGRLGAQAIAGVAMSGTVIMVLMTLIIGLVTATTAHISRHYGAKEYEPMGSVLVNSLYLGLLISAILSIIGLFFSEDILLLMGAESKVATLGSQYLYTLLLGVFTMVELWIISASFQSTGDATTPMLIMLLMNMVNIVLDPALIFGLGGLPALGVAGAALATVLSRGLGLSIALAILLQGGSRLVLPKLPDLRIDLAARLLRLAIPNSVQSGIRSLSFLAVMTIVAAYGTEAISAFGIAARMEMVALMPGFGIATGTAVVVGQNLGARSPHRAEEGVKISLILYGAMMAMTSLIFYNLGGKIMELFDPSGSSTAIGVGYFHIVSLGYVFIAMAIVLSFAMNGAGDTKKPMYATLVSMALILIPLALILPGLLGIGIRGVWLASAIGMISQCLMMAYLYRKGGWKRVRI